MIKTHKTIPLISLLFLSGCSSLFFGESKTTSYKNNACSMLKQNEDWKESTYDVYKKWGTPVAVQLAFIRQESMFKYNAKPIRMNKWYEWGENYHSSAYGFSQALDGTWDHYKKRTGQTFVDRTSFRDSVFFIGWYNHESQKQIGLSKTDSYSLYLAYHEGWTGFKRKTYNNKSWLKGAASKVSYWTSTYNKQLKKCRIDW